MVVAVVVVVVVMMIMVLTAAMMGLRPERLERPPKPEGGWVRSMGRA